MRETSILVVIALIFSGSIFATVIGKAGFPSKLITIAERLKVVSKLAPPPKLTGNLADVSMKQDLLKTTSGIHLALSGWRNTPPADVPITFNASTLIWSVIYQGKSFASGKASIGNTISGTIWTNGSYCVQATNPSGTNTWKIESATPQIISGSCGNIPLPK